MHPQRLTISMVIGALSLAACSERPAPVAPAPTAAHALVSQPGDGRYLVVFATEQVPDDFAGRVANLGGAVEASLDAIGVAAVTGLTDPAAAALAADAGILHVEPDVPEQMTDHGAADVEETMSETVAPADATALPTAAQFYARQWNLRAVFAPEAWAAGHLGSREVVVAILDTGIDYLHHDIEGLVDLARSKSFVPEDVIPARYADRLPFSDLFWHGTAAASIVASNASVVAGVNRYVTLLAVKVADSTSAHTAGRLLAGIVYAADQGADVINISRGSQRSRSEGLGFVAAFERAVNYAFHKGALVVSVPFNDAVDLDRNADVVRMPCEAANAICVSATAPTGAAGMAGPWENVDAFAPYSAFGRSAVSVAAPGGAGAGFPLLFTKVWLPCTTTTTRSSPAPCRARQPITQGIGTSWSAPHVAGLAALLVAQLGHGNPALIRARILESTDDLGEPGVDPYYGHGRINVARALGLME